ncbi:unnamed protein product, partial [Thlaspi arvense]
MFQQVGRISGKSTTAWLIDEDYNVLQTFLLLNLEEFTPYERMFEEYITLNISNITSDAMTRAKNEQFAEWFKNYVRVKI